MSDTTVGTLLALCESLREGNTRLLAENEQLKQALRAAMGGAVADSVPMPIAKAVRAMVNRIGPFLVDQPPEVIGAALAELTSVWLAAHQTTGERAELEECREAIFANFCELVRTLVPVNEKAMAGDKDAAS
jgi:hypothetical protein